MSVETGHFLTSTDSRRAIAGYTSCILSAGKYQSHIVSMQNSNNNDQFLGKRNSQGQGKEYDQAKRNMKGTKITNKDILEEDLAMEPIIFSGNTQVIPDLENVDFLAQFPNMIYQALGVNWLNSKLKIQRYLGNSTLCKSIIGLMETLDRPIAVFLPTTTKFRIYNWLNWAPRFTLPPLAL